MQVEWLDHDEWYQVADMMDVRKEVTGTGYVATKTMLDKTLQQARESGDPFTDEEVALLEAHILSVQPSPQDILQLQDKVVRHAREALRADLHRGPTTKIAFMAKWPDSWLRDYQASVEGMCPMLFAAALQNAFASDGQLWKP